MAGGDGRVRKSKQEHYICRSCKQDIDGEERQLGCPPVYQGSRYATCVPCRDGSSLYVPQGIESMVAIIAAVDAA
jgi:hypothetical protein